ncbi:MAG: thioredoxin family protein [Flavisolibacter sp.]
MNGQFKLFLCAAFVLFFQMAEAQGIAFSEKNWEGIAAEAKATGKLIFMDAHTTWCGPCKWMKANVFSDAKVGGLYNRNFVNAYIDMEKGEGVNLREKYDVKYYPTLLFINGDGEVVHKIVGSRAVDEFIQNGLDALSPQRNLKYLADNYAKKKTDYEFVHAYLKALQLAYDADGANRVALDYLQSQEPSTWLRYQNWVLIRDYVTDATSPVFTNLVNHQQDYSDAFGAKPVEDKIYQTYLGWPIHYVQFPPDAAPVFDEKGFTQFLAGVKAAPYARKQEIAAKSKLTIYFSLRDYEGYAKTVNEMLQQEIISNDVGGADLLYGYADNVFRFTKEKTALAAAAGWAKRLTQTPGVRPHSLATYQDLYANLLEATGKDQLALQVRKTIDQKLLKEAKEGAPFQQMRIIPKQN